MMQSALKRRDCVCVALLGVRNALPQVPVWLSLRDGVWRVCALHVSGELFELYRAESLIAWKGKRAAYRVDAGALDCIRWCLRRGYLVCPGLGYLLRYLQRFGLVHVGQCVAGASPAERVSSDVLSSWRAVSPQGAEVPQ